MTVRHSAIFDDTVQELCFGYTDRNHFLVTFVGDAAVDEGGPRREYFMLLMGVLKEKLAVAEQET